MKFFSEEDNLALKKIRILLKDYGKALSKEDKKELENIQRRAELLFISPNKKEKQFINQLFSRTL